MNLADTNERPDFDEVIQKIADYALQEGVGSELARETAQHCLMDTLGCGMLALRFPECTKLMGPVVAETQVPNGARVPGTSYQLDPVKAAWDIGCMIRWLDYNDTWLAAEWGHPSDNLGAILAVADYVSRVRRARGESPVRMAAVLEGMIKAHEIQGVLALTNSFNRVGLDHVLLVKVASTAVACWLLGLSREQTLVAVSHAWLDGQALRTYRHAPNAGSRKSWAAGDATSRAVRLALIAETGEMGYPGVLSTPTWGFEDVCMRGGKIDLEREFGCYVMENVLFKISFPAEFHAQTAVEAAVQLHPQVADRLSDIKRIRVLTHESAIRIISKTGSLNNPADRDHCLQYMIAIGLIHGDLRAEHYEDDVAADPRIDALRECMEVSEDKSYSRDYMDSEKRSIANRLQVEFKDGSISSEVAVEYPIGHRLRRQEGIPQLVEKARLNIATRLSPAKSAALMALMSDRTQLEQVAVDDFVSMTVL